MTPSGPPPVPGGRRPEEREAARREREARRAAREAGKGDGRAAKSDGRSGHATRQAPPADGDGHTKKADGLAAKADGGVDRSARRAQKQQERAAARAGREAAKEERRAAREAFKAREDARKAQEKARKEEAAPDRPARGRGRPAKAAGAVAATAAESWRERAQRLTGGRDGSAPRESRRPRREAWRRSPPANARVAGRRRLAVGLAVVGTLLGLVALWFLFSLFQPLAGDGRGEGRVSVRVPAGAGVGAIAEVLEERGVVGSAFFFQTRTRLAGRSGDLKPGLYTLGEGMSIGAALDALAKGPAPDVLNVTVPEGRSRREVARTLPNQLPGDYVSATRRSSRLNPSRYGAPRGSSLEGFLFPSTYEIKRGRAVKVLVDEQLAAFRKQFARVDLGPSRRANLSPYEVLTIASMIEREAQQPRERALVASVIYNRLRDGIPLGIDATIRYVTNNWDRPLKQSQLQVQSLYNTRTNRGLPPGPIGSPGIDAIRAAARPARSGYLFYVVKPGTCGEHAFSQTNAEFEADVARYNRERERRGGKSPTKC